MYERILFLIKNANTSDTFMEYFYTEIDENFRHYCLSIEE